MNNYIDFDKTTRSLELKHFTTGIVNLDISTDNKIAFRAVRLIEKEKKICEIKNKGYKSILKKTTAIYEHCNVGFEDFNEKIGTHSLSAIKFAVFDGDAYYHHVFILLDIKNEKAFILNVPSYKYEINYKKILFNYFENSEELKDYKITIIECKQIVNICKIIEEHIGKYDFEIDYCDYKDIKEFDVESTENIITETLDNEELIEEKIIEYQIPSLHNINNAIDNLFSFTGNYSSLMNLFAVHLYSVFYNNVKNTEYKFFTNVVYSDKDKLKAFLELYGKIFYHNDNNRRKSFVFNYEHIDSEELKRKFFYKNEILLFNVNKKFSTNDFKVFDNISKDVNFWKSNAIIASKYSIDSDLFLKIKIDKFDEKIFRNAKSNLNDLGNSIDEYKKYILNNDIDIDKMLDDKFEIIQQEVISDETTIQKLTAIVVNLELYFKFLYDAKALAKEEYEGYINKINALYMPDNSVNDDSANLTVEKVADKIIESIKMAYDITKDKLPKEPCKDATFVFLGSKNWNELLCFSNENILIKYLKDNTTIESSAVEFLIKNTTQIKKHLKGKNYLAFNNEEGKDRTELKIKLKEDNKLHSHIAICISKISK